MVFDPVGLDLFFIKNTEMQQLARSTLVGVVMSHITRPPPDKTPFMMILSQIIFNSYHHRAALDVSVLSPIRPSATRLVFTNLDFYSCMQAESLIDELLPDCRFIGDLRQCAQGQQGQRMRWTLMDRKSASHLGQAVRIAEKLRINSRFDFQRAIHSSHDFLFARRFKSARPRHFHFRKDTRHFPIREWLCLGAEFSARRIFSCVLPRAKGTHFAGKIGDCRL